jgi:hypothetical protein
MCFIYPSPMSNYIDVYRTMASNTRKELMHAVYRQIMISKAPVARIPLTHQIHPW